ncbi:hypothetical protein L596_016016 [Steinernema carpocapsae]|uniref:Uncharacterized protein n=1 Tax=Steinernema carpocapsae TaxID=34508 RepID=A0A4U5NHQ0_STECR|nr:hypothetical protein L596_016016 [Steinernema carpocapsae]
MDDVTKAKDRMEQYLKYIKMFQANHPKEMNVGNTGRRLAELKTEVENTISEIEEYFAQFGTESIYS